MSVITNSQEYKDYNSINSSRYQYNNFDERDIFVKIAISIYENYEIKKLYDYQKVVNNLVSQMTNLSSKINRLKLSEQNNVKFELRSETEPFISSYLEINEAKEIIRKDICDKLDCFVNYLKNFNNEKLNKITVQLVSIFNNIKEENIIRDYSKQVFSSAELSLRFSKENLNNYIQYVHCNKELSRNNKIPKNFENKTPENNSNNSNIFYSCIAASFIGLGTLFAVCYRDTTVVD